MMRELRSVGIGPVPELARVAGLETLEQALQLGLAQDPPWDVVDVIAQDEYTNDIVMCAGPAYLVLDAT